MVFVLAIQIHSLFRLQENLKPVHSNIDALTENIITKLQLHRMAGPFKEMPLPNLRCSPIGVVPKKNSDKVRMITDLSSPKGSAVNDFITDEELAVQFNHFDTAVNIVAGLVKLCLMAKLDIKRAFRI